MKKLLLIGGGEHARVVMDLAVQNGWKIEGYTDLKEESATTKLFSASFISDEEAISLLKTDNTLKIILGIGNDNTLKAKLIEKYKEFSEQWISLIDKTAVISSNVKISPGTVVLANSTIQSGACIGQHCIVNTASVIEHDCVLRDFSHIAPTAVLGGGVSVGENTLVGLGAKVRDHTRIGANVTVGTGAVVVSDIPDNLTVVGIPAIPLANQKAIDLESLILLPTTSLHNAMEAISHNGVTISLICDPEKKLLGILTDGDIRKALLQNIDMSTPVSEIMKKDFMSVHEKLSRKSALDIMIANFIEHLPVVADDGTLVNLHFLRGMLHKPALDIDVVIMAGGKGTRLLPLTENIPKPMVPVAGKPILEHILIHLVGQGIKSVYLAVNHLKDQIVDYFKDGAQFGIKINYLEEDVPLGTGGAITLLPDRKKPVLVMNSDLITQIDVPNLIETHRSKENVVTVGVRSYSHTVPYGVLNTESDQVVSISEKPKFNYLINAGIYLINCDQLNKIPKRKKFPITRLIEECLEEKEKIGYHLVEGEWIDVGQHADLARARGGA